MKAVLIHSLTSPLGRNQFMIIYLICGAVAWQQQFTQLSVVICFHAMRHTANAHVQSPTTTHHNNIHCSPNLLRTGNSCDD